MPKRLKPYGLTIFSWVGAAGIPVAAPHDHLPAAKKTGFFMRLHAVTAFDQIVLQMSKAALDGH